MILICGGINLSTWSIKLIHGNTNQTLGGIK
jgi:hypothetical protein